MNIELVTIGDELLLGYTIDTNGAFAARELAALGVSVVRRTSVGDGAEEIAGAVREALDRTGAVLTTGGLGPTSDDLTKPSIAALFGREMVLDETILESLRVRWRARGWPGELPASNALQAMIPEGATILENRHGSAPGIWLEDAAGRWVAMLPGVPREMRGMVRDTLVPRLAMRVAADPIVVRSRTLRTTGIAESRVADRVKELGFGLDGLSLAFLPGWEGVDLRLTVRSLTASAADERLARALEGLREGLAAHCYGEGEADLAELVIGQLRGQQSTLAVAESCTGGLLGGRITAIPGSSDVFLGGVIAYANEVKVRELGVASSTLDSAGAVSEETAREMAIGVRARFGATIGVSITGVAGPDGGSPEKPVGTYCIGVAHPGGVWSLRTTSVGDRAEIRQRCAQAALEAIRRNVSAPKP